jgi:predicted ATPase
LLQQPFLEKRSSSSSNNDEVLSGLAPPTCLAAAAAGNSQRLYYWPLNPDAEAALNRRWSDTLTALHKQGSNSGSSSSFLRPHQQQQQQYDADSSGLYRPAVPPHPAAQQAAAPAAVLPVLFGRQLAVPRAAAGAAWFSFQELCAAPLGAADYLAVAQHYHTVFISGATPVI